MAGVAIVLTLGLGGVAFGDKADKVKVDSATSLSDDYDYDLDTGFVTIYGDVSSQKRACERRREVTLRQVDQGLVAGTDKTDSSGDYAVEFFGSGAIEEGNFQATAAKKKIKKRRDGEVKKIIICKKDASPVVEIGESM
jgi:hypothetical protein